ncbi:MAG TPA: glycosyltransferase family 4 protein [Capsulimonadaceae bacterium]|nr:glycosyltransferase family 4 protein [Capsulimonadaceae bacterium]
MQQNQRSLSILQIASGFPAWGGTELHILNLSAQLTRRGHHVTVACRPGGWVDSKAREMGLDTMAATVRRQQDWSDFHTLRRWCKANRIDVVHTHWSTDAFVPAAAGLAAHVPVRLMTRHSPYPFKTGLGRFCFTQVLYNRLLAVSQSVATTLHGCGVPKDQLTVIHHGTDVEAFENVTKSRPQVRSEFGFAPQDVTVGILGRVAEEKGHQYLFDAALNLGLSRPLKFVVVGDGPLAEMCQRYVQEKGLAGRVIFHPFRADINNVINALDIVTVPSTWEEPCSAVIQQAMALAKPVVATRVGGNPEMVIDGQTGLLVARGDADALAGAIATLADDPELRNMYGGAGAERVRALFTLQGMTARIEAIYYQEFEKTRGAGTGTSDLRKREAVPA